MSFQACLRKDGSCWRQEMQGRRRHRRTLKMGDTRNHVKMSIWRKGRKNEGNEWKEKFLGTCKEMNPWKEVLYDEQGTPLRNCILCVSHAGAGTPPKGLWYRGNPCQSRGAVWSKKEYKKEISVCCSQPSALPISSSKSLEGLIVIYVKTRVVETRKGKEMVCSWVWTRGREGISQNISSPTTLTNN